MDPLIPALVAVLLAGGVDRPPLLTAILADRFGVARVVAGAAAAHVAGFAVASLAGAMVAPLLTPNARALLLAAALLSAGASAMVGAAIRDRLDRWRIGGPATAFAGVGILALGDRSQFLVFALAARSQAPALAAGGATIAALAVAIAAASIGERGWARLPIRPIRYAVAGLFLLTGAWTALGALRLL